MNASFLSVELRVALFVRLLASKLFLLDGNSFNCIPYASCSGPYALSTWNPSVHMPQTHIYLFHNLFLFMPQPLCYRVIYNFFSFLLFLQAPRFPFLVCSDFITSGAQVSYFYPAHHTPFLVWQSRFHVLPTALWHTCYWILARFEALHFHWIHAPVVPV